VTAARRPLAAALAALVLAGAGCGDDKQLPPSDMPVLIPACRDGRGPALSDRARDVTFHAFPGRRVRVEPPPPSADLARAAVTVTDKTLCLTARTARGTPPGLRLTARKKDDEESELWNVSVSRDGGPRYYTSKREQPAPIAGARVVRRGSLTAVAVPLSAVDDGPFDGDFEWQLTAQKDVFGPNGRPPQVAQHVDCLTRSTAWARFPEGTRVRRPLLPVRMAPGCVP
jgi:hypothetical protein